MTSLLTPMLALIAWTLVVLVWMCATRLPAMRAAGIAPQDAAHPTALDALPSSARRVADNYNHLFEQPTIFYALVLYIIFKGHSDGLHIYMAWAYVGLRVLHSLIQCTVNIVNLRFLVFVLSSLVLMAMTAREVLSFF